MLILHIADVAVLVAIGIYPAHLIKIMGNFFVPRTSGKELLC